MHQSAAFGYECGRVRARSSAPEVGAPGWLAHINPAQEAGAGEKASCGQLTASTTSDHGPKPSAPAMPMVSRRFISSSAAMASSRVA